MDKQQKKELVEKFKKLRVADVRDGMDWVGLHPIGSVAPEIRPIWRTKIVGFARTARYIPTTHVVTARTPEEYTKFLQNYWNEISPDPFKHDIEEDDIIVLDCADTNIGIVGSFNSFDWYERGARGVVTNGGARDTDEIILQEVPVWSRYISQSMPIGRAQYDGKDMDVNIGGQIVRPGDVIVADGDGVIVVPIEKAELVAKYALEEQLRDRAMRREVYEKLGRELDDTVI